MRGMVDDDQSHRDQLTEDTAPLQIAHVRADPENAQAMMIPAQHALAHATAKHIDKMHHTKTLSGSVDGG